MKLSEQWLRERVNPSVDTSELVSQLNMAGLEVDSIIPAAGVFTGVVVGEVVKTVPHPNASKLTCCEVSVGEEELLAIICGAPNVREGLKVAVATVGAKLPGDFKIKKAKLRGEPSHGMLCSSSELGIDLPSDGIMELSPNAPVGTCFREYLNLDDNVLELDLTPNRGDCLSVRGMAREIAALNKMTFTDKAYQAITPSSDVSLGIEIAAPKACPGYVGRVVSDLNMQAETPLWMSERLRRSGIKTHSITVDITNYVMLELGQPMHAFDLATLNEKIVVRYAKVEEKLTLLDEQTVTLKPDTLVIADSDKAVAIAGVMGGLDSSVTEKTTDIFFESAHFSPVELAGVARSYGLTTDSAHRFERGVDPQLPLIALERATELLLSIAGGQAGPICGEEPQPAAKPTIELALEKSNRMLGLRLSADETAELLKRLQMQVELKSEMLLVTPPSHRFDLSIDVDLVEEVARMVGYENIPTHTIVAEVNPVSHSECLRLDDALRESMVAMGYNEVVSYSFVSPEEQSVLYDIPHPIDLVNPLSEELSQMRHGLLPGLLKSASYNLARQVTHCRLFEMGVCFASDGDTRVEENRLAGLILGKRTQDDWNADARAYDFYDIKGDAEALLAATGLSFTVQRPEQQKTFHPGVSAEILLDGQAAGLIGKLHPSVLKAFDIDVDVFAFEVSVSQVNQAGLPKYQSISKFPQVRRDLSFLVDEQTLFGDIVKVVNEQPSEFLQEVKIFDVYQGDNIEKGKKSIALGLILQHASRTLLDTEVNDYIGAIIEILRQRFTIILRDTK